MQKLPRAKKTTQVSHEYPAVVGVVRFIYGGRQSGYTYREIARECGIDYENFNRRAQRLRRESLGFLTIIPRRGKSLSRMKRATRVDRATAVQRVKDGIPPRRIDFL